MYNSFQLANPKTVGKILAFQLLGTILLLPAASALPSREGNRLFSDEIALLPPSFSSDRTGIELMTGLLHTVVVQEDDQKIWTKTYEVLA